MDDVPSVVKDPPYERLCNRDGKAGQEPNLLVDERPRLRVSHVRELVVDGPLSDVEYARSFCQYESFGGVTREDSRERFVEFLQAVWQAVEFLEEHGDALEELDRYEE